MPGRIAGGMLLLASTTPASTPFVAPVVPPAAVPRRLQGGSLLLASSAAVSVVPPSGPPGVGLTIRAAFLSPDAATTTLSFVGGLSAAVPLPGSALAVRLGVATPSRSAWRVEVDAAPAADLGEVALRVAACGAGALAELFGLSPAEPYRTWRNLWASDMPLPYRLGAIALALARRTAEAGGTR